MRAIVDYKFTQNHLIWICVASVKSNFLRDFDISFKKTQQINLYISKFYAFQPTGENDYLNDNPYDSFEGFTDYKEQPIGEESNDQEEQGDDNDDYNSFNGGVCPRELERRLNEVVQSRQKERIEQLEYALEFAKSKLHEKEKEICWWQDTARLVTQHRDDSHFRYIFLND